MASKFTGFLDNLANGALNPKGNLADWQHADRLYLNDNQKHAPKLKFLYHVTFYLTEQAKSVIQEVDQYKHVIGMLVKSVDLPSYTAQVETKNKYNRKKNVQSRIDYSPVNIVFHDDNFGATTALMEAYYKYYFADGNQNLNNGSYGNRRTGDTTYDGSGTNTFNFGMNNNIPSVPFFDRIEIAQLARKSYTKYTLVNPIVTTWGHDQAANTESGPMQNSMTLQYDTVFYDRGYVEAGENGNPAGFGRTDHYDVTPSPITLTGGGTLGIDGIFGAGVDLYEYITQGKNFSNPFEAAVAGVNLIGNIRNTTAEGLREGGFRILTGAIGDAAGIDVSGVAQTFFPKNGGSGGGKDLLIAGAVVGGLSLLKNANASSPSTTTGDVNPTQQNDARFQNFLKDYQSNGGTGGMNGARASFDALPDREKANYS
jgi:hypothetical protein